MNLIRTIRSWFTPDAVFETRLVGAQMPFRGSVEAAGLDLYACEKLVRVAPGQTVMVDTGVVSKFNKGWCGFIWDRGSMGVKGIHRLAGVVDSDFRDTWKVIINNTTSETFVIRQGDRIAQVVFQRVWMGKPKQGTVKVDSERGTGAFGSTGK